MKEALENMQTSFPNGREWTQVYNSSRLYSLEYANGVFIACGDDVILYSTDGKTWTKISDFDVRCVKNANGIWVACGSDGLYYSVDGMTWNVSNMVETIFSSCEYANGIWVACGGTGAKGLYYSTDGMTWTTVDSPTYGFSGVHYSDGVWIATSSASNSCGIYYSTDGITWAKSNLTSGSDFKTYNANGVWVTGYSSSSKGLYYSTDGSTWTETNSPAGYKRYIYNANGLWIARLGSQNCYSYDGISWTSIDNGLSTTGPTIECENGIWIAGAASGATTGMFYSYDGLNWELTTAKTGNVYDVRFINGVWYAATHNGIFYSIGWEPPQS